MTISDRQALTSARAAAASARTSVKAASKSAKVVARAVSNVTGGRVGSGGGGSSIKPDAIRLATATATKSGSTVTVTADGIEVTVQVARDLTVASGDVLILLMYQSQWIAVGRMYTAAPADTSGTNTPAPSPKPTVVTGTTVIAPSETRSYRSGGWRTDNDDVYQGQYAGNGNHTGCVFYGTKPRSLSGVTVTGATIRVLRPDAGGAYAAQATTMRLVTQATRPAGAPTLTSSTSGPSLRRGGRNDAFAVPTAWAQSIVDGTAGGIGFFTSSGSPYVIFAGRGRWSPAFTMTISWKRVT